MAFVLENDTETGLISGLIGNPTNSPCGIVLHPHCNILYKWRGSFHAPMKSKRDCDICAVEEWKCKIA